MQFQDLPIKRKLVVIILLTSLSVLTLTCLVLLTYEIFSYQQTTRRSLSTMAEIITANSSPALIFDDQKMAQEILSGLRAEPEVVAAAIFNRDGKLYATYPTNMNGALLPAMPHSDGIRFQLKRLTLFKPVLQGDRRVGTLFMEADLHGMYRRLGVYGAVLLLVLTGSGLVALLLSNLFQRRISQPLLDLANTARMVSGNKDFSVRAVKTSRDEIGYLTEAFNSMLHQIQASHSALWESEARLSGVFNQAGAGIAQCDLAGRFLLVNDQYCEITGHNREDLLKIRMQDITYPEDQAESVSALKNLIEGSPTSILEQRYVRASGEVVWARVSVAPLRDAGGKIESALAVAQDITERKRAEQEVERARDAAERANRAKDEFLAALSHELRTPLNPVLLLASESANDPQLPETARADFATIAKNVALEARLIDDLLDVTRITRGKLALELQPTNVHTVLRDALATVQADLDLKGIRLDLNLGAEQHTVLGDAVRLQQVFWNILKNAVKFTPVRGKVTVQTIASRNGETGGNLTVVISDTGIGITTAELVGIFEAFKQGEHALNGMSHQFGGLGLGLAISRMLIELHSGTIQALSRGRGQGAAFTVRLPLMSVAQIVAGPDPAPRPSASPLPIASSSPRRAAILLVEDHEPTRTTLAQLLVRRQYEVKTAASLKEARPDA